MLRLVLGVVGHADARGYVLVRGRDVRLRPVCVGDVPRVVPADLAGSIWVLVGQHGAVEAAQALSERHVIRKVLPSLGGLRREEVDHAVLTPPTRRGFDGGELGDLRRRAKVWGWPLAHLCGLHGGPEAVRAILRR